MQVKIKKIKIAIIVLSVLLAVSLAALAGTLIYKNLLPKSAPTATVSNNLILPEAENGSTSQSGAAQNAVTSSNGSAGALSMGGTVLKNVSTLRLFDRQPGDNEPFSFKNMFPGDSVTKNFCVQVSYKGKVDVHYKAVLKLGDSELAKALNVRVQMPEVGNVLYDGPIAAMPESVTTKISAAAPATTELYYEITAYISTAAGNEYQNKSLVADFEWWVEETENLLPSPETGDSTEVLRYVFAATLALIACLVLAFMRRRKGEPNRA